MAESAAFPAEFRSLEEDFVESKMAINNSINEILHNEGSCVFGHHKSLRESCADWECLIPCVLWRCSDLVDCNADRAGERGRSAALRTCVVCGARAREGGGMREH